MGDKVNNKKLNLYFLYLNIAIYCYSYINIFVEIILI